MTLEHINLVRKSMLKITNKENEIKCIDIQIDFPTSEELDIHE